MRVVDCFGLGFFHELDLLEIRLNVLDPVVTDFVIVESTRTFTNKPKPLVFEANKERFSKFLPKITHVVLDKFPEQIGDAWVIENLQRRWQMKGLYKLNLDDDDVVFTSDLDEIINPEIVRDVILKVQTHSEHRIALTQKLFYYYLNVTYPDTIITCKFHSKASTWSELQLLGDTQVLRLVDCSVHQANGGWHFSFIGGIDAIKRKIDGFAHQEYNKPELVDTKALQKKIDNNEDIFDRFTYAVYQTVPIDESFPKYIRENVTKYKQLIKDNDKKIISRNEEVIPTIKNSNNRRVIPGLSKF